MLIAGTVEIPDTCPVGCPVSKEPFYQGNLCCRCPVLICRKIIAPVEFAGPDGTFCLVEPEEYRKDWALIFQSWFGSGMIGYPDLPLMQREMSKIDEMSDQNSEEEEEKRQND